MASSSSAVNDSVILTEDDIPGASLAGRNPSSLKNEELRFWLRCREDSLKGLKTKALLVKRYAQCIDFYSSLTVISYKYFFSNSLCRVEEYVKSGRDQMVIDPDPNEIYTKRKKRIVNVMMSSTPSSSPSVKYPNDGWGNSLERMPSFARAEMNQHITNPGKKVASIQHHSIPTNLKKGENFFDRPIFKRYRGN